MIINIQYIIIRLPDVACCRCFTAHAPCSDGCDTVVLVLSSLSFLVPIEKCHAKYNLYTITHYIFIISYILH